MCGVENVKQKKSCGDSDFDHEYKVRNYNLLETD